MSLAAEFLQAGVGVKESDVDAALLFKKAADAGDIIAANNMGEILSETNPAGAMQYFMRVAASGDDRGMLAYGMGQIRGNGTAKNEAEGVQLVQAAAQAGNPTAQRLMGIFYTNGSHGVKQDDTAGRLYMEAAATNGDSDAQIDFGIMNLDGDMGIPKNHDVGMQWITKAAKQQNPRALEEMKKRM
jgi:TPR repeat protein